MAKRLHTQKNDIIILLFIQQKYKNEEIAFLMYRNMSKHVFFGSWHQSYSQGCHKGKIHRGFDLVSQATPFTVSLFGGSEVLARLMSCTKGKLCKVRHHRNLRLSYCTHIHTRIEATYIERSLLIVAVHYGCYLRVRIPVRSCQSAF